MASSTGEAVELGDTGDRVPPKKPFVIVIFGGAGDLTRRKLLPALYNLAIDGELPECCSVTSFSQEDMTDESYREFARDGVEKFSRRPLDQDSWARFAGMLRYVRGSFTEMADYGRLAARLAEIDRQLGIAGNRIFYFAVPPRFIPIVAGNLTQARMVQSPEETSRFSRVVIEKPIGRDLATAAEINRQLSAHFAESQTFRIDHYLGKETVENLMVLRFANAVFEPLWNSRFIDHVQITVAEADGVGTRAPYYERAGALRDMVQSHLLQLVCMIAMEPPRATAADSVRDAKLDVLRTLRPFTAEDVERWVIRGQYGAGLVDGAVAAAYRAEEHVAANSIVETFVALRCWIDNWRWAGVPFYLRTGKRMAKRASEIAIFFDAVPRVLFNAGPRPILEPNMLTIKIQPDEGLALHITSKVPGPVLKLNRVEVDFHYSRTPPEAYETLLGDVMIGDQTLFMRRDSIEEAWRFVEPILDGWATAPVEPRPYAAGSWGPLESDLMIAADGRKWRMF